MKNIHYKRVLIKLSGEVLSGKKEFGIDYSIVSSLANQIKGIHKEKTEIGLEIKSGRKQIAKKIFEHLGYRVLKLDLVFFGGLTKKNLSRKEYRFLTTEEVNLLKRL